MVLENIKSILEKEEFTCSISSATAEIPVERLTVFLGLDVKKRERILEIMALQQQALPEFSSPKKDTLPYRLHFRVPLPFKIKDLNMNQVASLLLFLNQFIDLPGFELDELNGQVIYRYVWIIKPDVIDAPLIMSIMGSVLLNLSLFSETIESLASGEMTFTELLAQIIQLIEHSKNK